MTPKEEFPTIKHIETNYIIFSEQLNVNITKIYSQNLNQIWKKSSQVIKMIINKRKCNLTCSKFKCNGSVIEDGKVIANKSNDSFVNAGPSLAKNIPSTKKNPTEYITQNIETVFAVSPVSWIATEYDKACKTRYKASISWYLQFIFWYRCIAQWLKNSKCCAYL